MLVAVLAILVAPPVPSVGEACGWPKEPLKNGSGCGLNDCAHGVWNTSLDKCSCQDNFTRAGISNPAHFFLGKCSQYQCKSEELCTSALGVPATCPKKGWNCDCGIWHASKGNGEAQCMYLWWAVMSKCTRGLKFLTKELWKVVCIVSLLMLPFGKNIVGAADVYSIGLLSNDIAWSIFTFKLGMWIYAFCATSYFALVFFGLMFYMVMIAVTLCLCGTAAFCCTLGATGGDVGASCSACECGSCECCSTACCSADECLYCCYPYEARTMHMGVLYYYDPCWGGWGGYYPPLAYDCDCATANCLQSYLTWIPCCRLLVGLFPQLPENMLGGFFGLLVGTHPMCNWRDANSCLFQLLARPCVSLGNRSDEWRQLVYQWLHERDADAAAQQAGMHVQEARQDGGSTMYGNVAVEQEVGVFSPEDRIFNYEDYDSNSCWICQEESASWDLWATCRHAFCTRCSGEMMRRQMPCPLCRVRSGRVLRREAREARRSSKSVRQVEMKDRRSGELEQPVMAPL